MTKDYNVVGYLQNGQKFVNASMDKVGVRKANYGDGRGRGGLGSGS